MDNELFNVRYTAETDTPGILSVSDPFFQDQRSKSREHTDRFRQNEISQKTEKNEETES